MAKFSFDSHILMNLNRINDFMLSTENPRVPIKIIKTENRKTFFSSFVDFKRFRFHSIYLNTIDFVIGRKILPKSGFAKGSGAPR